MRSAKAQPPAPTRSKTGKRWPNQTRRHPPAFGAKTFGKKRDPQTQKLNHTAQKRDIQPNIARLLDRLSSMSLSELKDLWINCIHCKTATPNKAWLAAADKLQMAIEKEWSRPRRYNRVDQPFSWPSTEAPDGVGGLAISSVRSGILDFFDYHVGRRNGRIESERRAILARVFLGRLPHLFPDEYLIAWGEPRTAKRLQKIAETLAAFVRNAKRRHDEHLADAISEWCADLRFLYETYYLNRPVFSWPSVAV